MSPIRLGVIGLSADKSAWATSAHVGPLRSAPLSDKYTITAVATSSAKTAQAAADFHKIPADKAYHSATDIANDPDVDMVVVSVKVQKHKELTIPALNAKKDVCIEWPLGKGLQQAEELAALAKTQGVKTVVCLQARTLPIIQKVWSPSAHAREMKAVLISDSIGQRYHRFRRLRPHSQYQSGHFK